MFSKHREYWNWKVIACTGTRKITIVSKSNQRTDNSDQQCIIAVKRDEIPDSSPVRWNTSSIYISTH